MRWQSTETPALMRKKGQNLKLEGYPGLHSEFWDSLGQLSKILSEDEEEEEGEEERKEERGSMRRKGEDREGRGGGTRAALAPPKQRMRSTLFILSIADSQNAHKHTAADHMHTFSANVIIKNTAKLCTRLPWSLTETRTALTHGV